MNSKIKYSEIFHSIQGEGQLIGTPSIFFRTSFCNLRCSWCDTPYTSHNPEDKGIDSKKVFNKISEYNCDHVVITGGEPFLQLEKIQWLCAYLSSAGKHITIETNGTIFGPIEADLISVSPKTRNSLPTLRQVSKRMQKTHEKVRINYESLNNFVKFHEYQFKFVVTNSSDLVEILDIVEKCNAEHDKVFLMPEGRTKSEIEEKEPWLMESCKEHGFKYSDRLQVRIWGDKRGV